MRSTSTIDPGAGTTAPPSPSRPWHAMEADAAVAALGVDPARGLDTAQAEQRRAQHGPNRLAEAPRRPTWRLFVDQFRNVLIVVLMVAAVLAGLVGDLKDTIVISVVLVLNAVLGFVQEHRAERSLAALRGMLAPVAAVRRDGAVAQVPADDLVPGDVLLLDTGDRVPADGRLVVARGIEVDESALTGESSPVAKSVAAVAADAPLAERVGMVHANTVVTRGRAEVAVAATGMATEIGRLAGMLQKARQPQTPLQVQLHALGVRLALLAAGAVGVFFVLGLLRGQGLAETILSSVALAVAAIPEGLPAVVTVTLAVGIHQLARRGAIVKRLASVETLGATTVICSDKTGTLTLNQMTARAVVAGGATYRVSGTGYRAEGTVSGGGADAADGALRDVLVAAALCNDSHVDDGALVGDPTEGALVTLAATGGIDAVELRRTAPRLAELPFDSARKLMATVHDDDGQVVLVAKGAPDVLLGHCSGVVTADGVAMLDDGARADFQRRVDDLAAQGLRVLALARRRLPAVPEDGGDTLLQEVADLTLLGLVGLQDPPRPEARDAIATCGRAGVAVKMITGDHAATATAIARELGIAGDVVTGADLDRLSDEQLRREVARIGVFARVAPEHKVRIVAALQHDGHVVAMTGDGVNDAPALKTADIGVAMGVTGTEVSKEAAAMVLTDDNFATIVRAVHAGRTIYDNILKFVRFQLSTNLGAITSLLGAQIVGLPVPFTAVQVLWVNIIMDGPPAIALGTDPASPSAMQRRPRDPGARILTGRRLLRLAALGLVMAAGTLGVLAYGLRGGDEPRALAMTFTTFVLFQVANAFNARSEEASVFSRETLRNRRLWAALAGVVALQVAAVHVGALQTLFDTTALALRDWILVTAVASTILWVEELRKLVARARRR
ncbi:MAG TPA: HAD-IC family P-type ATPase [Euzebyales bacterium]|nr:HAD-IC family P-type ATPase [Euzebyales bacterium]